MKSKLTLGEKQKDLRIAKKLKLADVEETTGISTSTLQRLEADEDIRIGYQDTEVLARFYDVSTDYLFVLTDLQQSVVDEDEYLRYRISERFNLVMINLFETHKKDKLPPEQADMITEMKEQIETYLDTQKTVSANKAKAILMCKQLGLNTAKLTDEEWRVLMKTLENSAPVRRVKKRK